MLKDVAWIGSSKADLSAFPSKAKVDMGYQVHLIQTGQNADDWKPLKGLGKGGMQRQLSCPVRIDSLIN
jgi:phage-related protein